jgi:phosphoadenosine phosphosulfate reductase
MHVTMVKKELLDGSPCKKCLQAEELLQRRGLWSKIDEVVVARESDADSPGMRLAAKHGVELAPFFIVRDGGRETVLTSVLEVIKQHLAPAGAGAPGANASGGGNTPNGGDGTGGGNAPGGGGPTDDEVAELNRRFADAEPLPVIDYMLERFGDSSTLAFSGAEDVAVIDLAASTGRKFSVFTLDTGRLHPETYRFIDKVRTHYGIEIQLMCPDHVALEALVRKKGLFSFYEDGHSECCGIRKVEPLGRGLLGRRAWLSGQRRDQSPTRSSLERFEIDRAHTGPNGPLLKSNPLAQWSLDDVWRYLRSVNAPTNELHERGFISIGCEPCTRAIRPGEHERAGRWWWEEATKRECGLHTGRGSP